MRLLTPTFYFFEILAHLAAGIAPAKAANAAALAPPVAAAKLGI